MDKFLNELEASKLLSSYGIPMTESKVCKTKEEAILKVEKMNFPLVMKILSPDIQHKTDANCVFLGINSIEEVKINFEKILINARNYNIDARIDGVLIQEMAANGLEVIIGIKKDPQFGPLVMVGLGGIYVEVFKDISLRLIPITRYDAEEMIKETNMYKIIQGARGVKYDEDCLINTILNLSDLIAGQPDIEEVDINPFLLYEEGKGGKGVDALIKKIEC